MTDWIELAECVGMGHLFFLEPGESSAPAKALCAVCPVRDECLEDSLRHPEPWHGIFGGLTPRERRNYVREHGMKRPARPIEHGTLAGYAMERRRGLETCRLCREAHSARIQRNKQHQLGKVAS